MNKETLITLFGVVIKIPLLATSLIIRIIATSLDIAVKIRLLSNVMVGL